MRSTQATVDQIYREGPIGLDEAAVLLGPRPNGSIRKTSTVADYITRGLHGVRLRAIRGPTGWLTSAVAVREFLAALADARSAEEGKPAGPPPGEAEDYGRPTAAQHAEVRRQLKEIFDARREAAKRAGEQ